MADSLKLGAHFAEDGNTWLGEQTMSTGIEFIILPDGGLTVEIGNRHETLGYDLSLEELEQMRAFLAVC